MTFNDVTVIPCHELSGVNESVTSADVNVRWC